ncbi:MAG: hypothetical protein ACMUIE_07350 [Thermoplasmatota archaeon]
MHGKRIWITIMLTALMVCGAFLALVPAGKDASASSPPTRGVLYKHTESHNLTFSAPTFYDDTDANYPSNKLENNTWDDIAFVIFFQDQHTSTTTVGTNTVTIADIYQAVFVNLSGKSKTTGTTQTILMEDFTATWCPYCTSIVGAMERLDHDSNWWPNKYIGVEYHTSGTYGNSIGTSRKNYYCSSSGIPTWIIDGVDATIGGGTDPNSTSTDNTIKSKINNRITTSPISITAKAGHSTNSAWVDFSFSVEDQNFDNKMVDCRVLMVQDAFPRRHGYDTDAYLGWIAQSMQTVTIFQSVSGSNPVISNVLPSEDSVLNGQVQITFDVTDADADDSKIVTSVGIREKGEVDWTPIAKEGGAYTWKTAEKTGGTYLFPDGDYEVRIWAKDYWDETSEHIFEVSVLNPDLPVLSIDNEFMQNQLDLDGIMGGVFDIKWQASDDEDGNVLSVDLYYKRPDIDWTPIEEGIENIGTYSWDTFDPRVPDNDRYQVMVRVTDSDEMSVEQWTSFNFEIDNPDAPVIEIQVPKAGQELSGSPTIRWSAHDDEDSATQLMVDIYISSDDGVSWQPLVMGVASTGSYNFDSNYYNDGFTYKIKLVITDTSDRSAEAVSDTFTIYNNDIPECILLEPKEEDLVTGTVMVEWSSKDEEDGREGLTYSLYYRHASGSYDKILAEDLANTGEYELDTTELEEGDGVYTLKLVVKDSRGEFSPSSSVYFYVYNPDPPEIVSATGPAGTVAGVASFTWYAEDPDPSETENLKIWFFISSDGEIWDLVAEGLMNSGTYIMDVSELEDATYSVKMVVWDCQEGDFNMSAEHLFPPLVVDNNDPPELEVTQGPDPSIEYDKTLSLSWSGTDPEGNPLVYSVYYRPLGTDGWIPFEGGYKVPSTSLMIDLEDFEDGTYELKIVASEESGQRLETELITTTFTVKHVADVIDDDDDDTQPISGDDDDSSSSSMLLVLVVVAGIAMVLIIALVIVGVVVMKKRDQEAKLPPPGGFPPAPQGPGLPPVTGGQLPGATTPAAQLPPAPQTQQPKPELPPSQPATDPQQPLAPPQGTEQTVEMPPTPQMPQQ